MPLPKKLSNPFVLDEAEFRESQRLMDNIQNELHSNFRQSRLQYWDNSYDQQTGKATIHSNSIFWLFFWADTAQTNSPEKIEIARGLFNSIFECSYDQFFNALHKASINFQTQGKDGLTEKESIEIRGRLRPLQPTQYTNNTLDIVIENILYLSSPQEDQKMSAQDTLKDYINLLHSNYNLILTGAPGTGKTYLAKQIAMQLLFSKNNEGDLTDDERRMFREHYDFVQFHPSYDYTDFVEGLRPIEADDDSVGFTLKNGIFKEFCKKALFPLSSDDFDEKYDQFINDFAESPFQFETPKLKRKFSIEINKNKTCVAIPSTEMRTKMRVTKDMIRDYIKNGHVRDWKPYLTAIGDYIKSHYQVSSVQNQKTDNLPYVFVIDEINRGEISKIFGELFFSIDPGYRGEEGKVKTQYSNLVDDDDPFKVGFYIPENVYIIGTMNDIDRSVESFDFAMRRRFVWKEVTAEESAENMKLKEKLGEEAVLRMASLNGVIKDIDDLGRHYQIGAAYFLKLEQYRLADGAHDYEKLWKLHLEPLLFEYVRALPKPEEQLAKLKKAYNEYKISAS